MKAYDYWDIVDLFSIQDLQKAEEDWFGFKVSESGVWLVDQRALRNPMGNNQLYSKDERSGRKESFTCSPAFIDFRVPVSINPPRIHESITIKVDMENIREIPLVEEVVTRARKMIENRSKKIIIPTIRPAWHEGYDSEGNPLLKFPCTEEELRSFIELTHLDFMLPPGHKLLKKAHTVTAGQPTSGNPEPLTQPVSATDSNTNRFFAGKRIYEEKDICSRLGYGGKSISAVRTLMKNAGIKFDYDKGQRGKKYLTIEKMEKLIEFKRQS